MKFFILAGSLSLLLSASASADMPLAEAPQAIQDAAAFSMDPVIRNLRADDEDKYLTLYGNAYSAAKLIETLKGQQGAEEQALVTKKKIELEKAIVQIHSELKLRDKLPFIYNHTLEGKVITDKTEVVEILNAIYDDCEATLEGDKIKLSGKISSGFLGSGQTPAVAIIENTDLVIRTPTESGRYVTAKNVDEFLKTYEADREIYENLDSAGSIGEMSYHDAFQVIFNSRYMHYRIRSDEIESSGHSNTYAAKTIENFFMIDTSKEADLECTPSDFVINAGKAE